MTENIEKAKEASLKAYAPYSNFYVGCAIKFKNGKFLLGANIENASYGATTCAERSAISVMYSWDWNANDIESITIYNDGKKLCSPCGICRQVLTEIVPSDKKLIITNGKQILETTISELLPFSFNKEILNV